MPQRSCRLPKQMPKSEKRRPTEGRGSKVFRRSMRVLLTGANGFLGRAILARLRAEGHEVVAVTRTGSTGIPADIELRVDIANALQPEQWIAHLHGIDAVVSCAGLLQDGPGHAL